MIALVARNILTGCFCDLEAHVQIFKPRTNIQNSSPLVSTIIGANRDNNGQHMSEV
jgi:hypothetical protein